MGDEHMDTRMLYFTERAMRPIRGWALVLSRIFKWKGALNELR